MLLGQQGPPPRNVAALALFRNSNPMPATLWGGVGGGAQWVPAPSPNLSSMDRCAIDSSFHRRLTAYPATKLSDEFVFVKCPALTQAMNHGIDGQ